MQHTLAQFSPVLLLILLCIGHALQAQQKYGAGARHPLNSTLVDNTSCTAGSTTMQILQFVLADAEMHAPTVQESLTVWEMIDILSVAPMASSNVTARILQDFREHGLEQTLQDLNMPDQVALLPDVQPLLDTSMVELLDAGQVVCRGAGEKRTYLHAKVMACCPRATCRCRFR